MSSTDNKRLGNHFFSLKKSLYLLHPIAQRIRIYNLFLLEIPQLDPLTIGVPIYQAQLVPKIFEEQSSIGKRQ